MSASVDGTTLRWTRAFTPEGEAGWVAMELEAGEGDATLHLVDQVFHGLGRQVIGFDGANLPGDVFGRKNRAGATDSLDLVHVTKIGFHRPELQTRSQARLFKIAFADFAPREKGLRHHDATHMKAFERLWLFALAEDQLRTATTDVEHQPGSVCRRHAMHDTVVNQPGFLDARDDFNRVTQRPLGFLAKVAAVAGTSQRTGSGGTYAGRMHISKPFAESRQAIQCALPRSLGQRALVLESFGQPYRFFEAIDNCELSMTKLTDDHVKAVGAQVDGGEDLAIGAFVLIGRFAVRGGVSYGVIDVSVSAEIAKERLYGKR